MATLQNVKLHCDECFLIEYGSIDRKNPEVIFLNYKTYLTSCCKNEEFRTIINDILKKLKQTVKEIVYKSKFNKNYIFDYDILQDIQPVFKNKILTFELFLKQPKDNILKIPKLKNDIEDLSRAFISVITQYMHSNNIALSKVKK